jgi:hypothetical protein
VQIKNRQQLLLILAGAVFGLLLADKLVLTPLTRLWQVRATRIGELRKHVTAGEQLIAREQTLNERWAQMRTNALPREQSRAEQQVLNAFDKWSQDARLSVNSITPQWRRDRDDLLTLQCRVDAAGSVGTLARFLYNLERDPMALKIEAVEIAARDKDGQNLSLGLQLSGLVLNGEEKQP